MALPLGKNIRFVDASATYMRWIGCVEQRANSNGAREPIARCILDQSHASTIR